MNSLQIPRKYELSLLPEFKQFQQLNPNHEIDSLQSIIAFGRAIHWLSIIDVLWPKFEEMDYYAVEVRYIVHNDPDKSSYPVEFYDQIASTLAFFWKIQLENLLPSGDWEVIIRDDPEITVDAYIKKRNPALRVE